MIVAIRDCRSSCGNTIPASAQLPNLWCCAPYLQLLGGAQSHAQAGDSCESWKSEHRKIVQLKYYVLAISIHRKSAQVLFPDALLWE